MKQSQIAASILSADFLNLERDIRLLAESSEPPEWFHVDVMDGHFVPNLTIGPPFVQALKRITKVPLDVHLMVDNPAQQLDWYLDAGADMLVFHLEDLREGARAESRGSSATITEISPAEMELGLSLLEKIHAAGTRAGIAVNPATPVKLLLPFYRELDIVLVMSVHPGFGGQSFIAETLQRLSEIRYTRDALAASLQIEVDGGIDADTACLALAAGADILVAGNAIYGQADPVAAMQQIRTALRQSPK